ncbi:MAG: hypothetical protein GYB31_00780 [Bacteroidetes bacterium]|nr:hypothetical protein [Bacteroidota bacterium]
MNYSELKNNIRDYFLDSEFSEIQNLLLTWVEENIADISLQNEALGHASDGRSISKKVRKNLLTREEADVEYAQWRENILSFLQTLKTYVERVEKEKASTQSSPELVKKVRSALEDLNYKKEILLFRKFQLQQKATRGVFMINGSKYYGQNWLYRLLLKPLRMKLGKDAIREVPIDFSGQIPVDLFWFELYDQFSVSVSNDDAGDRQKLLDTIVRIWEEDRSIIFRIEMNGDIPPEDLLNFLQDFWQPLYQQTADRDSPNMLLLFLVFSETFDHQRAAEEHQAKLATVIDDNWKPVHPLLLNIDLLDQNEVLRWLEGRILHFDDILDLNETATSLMKNQPKIYPEIVMIAFCMRYRLSFQNQILAKF